MPDSSAEAAKIWQPYSGKSQFWNISRTLASGIALLFALAALFQLGRRSA